MFELSDLPLGGCMNYHLFKVLVALITIAAVLVCGKLWFEFVVSSNMPDWLKYLFLK
jgi:hypothetical protein